MTKIGRRKFLKDIATASCAISGATIGSGLGSNIFGKGSNAYAQNLANKQKLLIVNLAGGLDTLAVFQPAFEVLAKMRPTLYTNPEDTLAINSSLSGTRFNKNLKTIANLFNTGSVAVIHKLGYERMSRSHYDADRAYAFGSYTRGESYQNGWVNRLAANNNFGELDVFDFPGHMTTTQGIYHPSVAKILSDFTLQDVQPENILDSPEAQVLVLYKTGLRKLSQQKK